MALAVGLQNLFLDLFFPRRCVTCHGEGAWLCENCKVGVVCEPERFKIGEVKVTALFDFNQPVVRELLHHLKYNGIRDAAEVLVKAARGATLEFPKDAVLVPVPTSRAKLKMRGYNQAEELAKELGRWLGLPVRTNLLFRREGKGSQVGKSAEERHHVEKGFYSKGVTKHPIILVDDVCTTGSTIESCVEVLPVFRVLVIAKA